MSRYFVGFFVSITIVGGVLSVGAEAQSAPSADVAFIDTIDVHVVQVEAVVTDREGRRVEGLGIEDFQLLVDGEERPIDYFSEVRGHRFVPSAEADGESPSGRSAPVRYLVFFDEVFTDGRSRRLMARELEQHVDALGPNDTMTLVAFDGTSPEVLVDASSDPRTLRTGLTVLGEQRFFRGGGQRAHREVFSDDAFASFGALGEGGDVTRSRGFARQRAHLSQREHLIDQQAEAVMEALASSMRRASRVAEPGRRVLLWVTGAWQIQGDIRAHDFGGDRPGDRSHDRKWRLERFGRLASRLGYTIYPVDAPGWLDKGFSELEMHATFETVAELTGGEAYLNSFRRQALGRVIDDVGSYYGLAFDAPWGSDDSEHTIEVVARRPDLEVRTRTEIWATPDDQLRQLDAVAARFIDRGRRFVGLDVQLGTANPISEDEILVPVELRFPVDALGALPKARGYELQLEVRVVAVDHRGRFTDPHAWPITLGAGGEPKAGDTALYAFEAILHEDTEKVLVTVHDRLSDTMLQSSTLVADAG